MDGVSASPLGQFYHDCCKEHQCNSVSEYQLFVRLASDAVLPLGLTSLTKEEIRIQLRDTAAEWKCNYAKEATSLCK